ncbi:isoprenylcysteine carboxylmethyltransferase family protein [Variovorax sp. dw_954]|uniref:methyltransferase family protein n=1 Tax=Variovorax sp. dw_954 TaxID=2720078 RepID=UPI001BD27F06
MNGVGDGHGLWSLVLLNTCVFVGFAYSFFKPTTSRDWKVFGAYSTFIAALFAEVYGYPLTMLLFHGWLAARVEDADLFGHEARHFWSLLMRNHSNPDPHTGALRFLSFATVLAGFVLLAMAWHVLHLAQRRDRVAATGPYRSIRHPQYVALALIMLGLLLHWPTLPTLSGLPLLLAMYLRLAISEERELTREFGEAWRDYAAMTPRFIPALRGDHRRHAE